MFFNVITQFFQEAFVGRSLISKKLDTPMVRATRGVFLLTEPSIREIILSLNEKQNFVIEQLNDNALFLLPNTDKGKEVENVLNGILKPGESPS